LQSTLQIRASVGVPMEAQIVSGPALVQVNLLLRVPRLPVERLGEVRDGLVVFTPRFVNVASLMVRLGMVGGRGG
jgi:hypothetical protein